MESQKQSTPGAADKISSRDLTTITEEQLLERLEELYDAVPEEEESENDFIRHQKEIKVIEAELEYRRKYGAPKMRIT